jgi:hypothetical protein
MLKDMIVVADETTKQLIDNVSREIQTTIEHSLDMEDIASRISTAVIKKLDGIENIRNDVSTIKSVVINMNTEMFESFIHALKKSSTAWINN